MVRKACDKCGRTNVLGVAQEGPVWCMRHGWTEGHVVDGRNESDAQQSKAGETATDE